MNFARLLGKSAIRRIEAVPAAFWVIAGVTTGLFLVALVITLEFAQAGIGRVTADLLPGTARGPAVPPFKSDALIYTFVEMAIFASLGFFWLWKQFSGLPLKEDYLDLPRPKRLAGIAELPRFGALRPGRRRLCAGLIALALIVAIMPMFTTWYPSAMPDDFSDIQETAQISLDGRTIALPREQLVFCISIAAHISGCPAPAATILAQNPNLLKSMRMTGYWQSDLGRTYFHHSYILVPAAHFMRYGLDRAVPYLYGYGNTIAQALILAAAGGVSISHYFLMLPWIEFLAMASIALLVKYLTRSWLAASGALAFSMWAFYRISFLAVFLAASYNPARYLGVELQLASLLFVFRGDAKSRAWVLPLAAGLSCFWNIEFAAMGALGQALALFSPHLKLKTLPRTLVLGLLGLVVAGAYLLLRPSADIVGAVWLGFYNIDVPIFEAGRFARDFAAILLVEAALFVVIFSAFSGGERDGRIAILGVLSLILIKWIFNPSGDNAAFSFVLIEPLMLVFLPWGEAGSRAPAWNRQILSYARLAVFVLAFAGCASGVRSEILGGAEFRRFYIHHYVAQPWTSLGETLPAVTPENPIASRVKAIRAQLQPGDKLLLLSPFDQLLSFYVNPPGYCGHFELLSNMVTRQIAERVEECAAKSAHVLIVKDDALEGAVSLRRV